MKLVVLSAVILIELASLARADESTIWRGAQMLECSPTAFKPEPRSPDKDPVYKILLGVDVDSQMIVRGMMIKHFTAFGQVYSRAQQYEGFRFMTDEDQGVKFLKWGGIYKKADDTVMVGYLFFNDGRWNYSEKTENKKTGEKKWMDSVCHETGNTSVPSP